MKSVKNPERAQELEQEAHVLAKLRHPRTFLYNCKPIAPISET